MAWEYSKKTMELFTAAVHGRPGTHLGEIPDADGIGEHGSIACGDALKFTFKVRRDDDPIKDKIIEAKYLTFGCTSAIAASEALCCIIEDRNLTPIESLKITNQDIVDFLEGLPDQKIHCSVMGAEALQAAVFHWAQNRGVNLNALGIDIHAEEQEEGRIVCKCFTLTEPYIKRKIKELNLRTISEITAAIKAGGACTSCQHSPGGLQDILNEVWGANTGANTRTQSPALGNLQILPIQNNVPSPARGLNNVPSPLGGRVRVGADLVNASSPPGEEGTTDTSQLSPFQISKRIEKLLNEYIRPMLRRDGGDLELIDIKEQTVYLELRGACASCAGAKQTIKGLIERTLKEQVDQRIRVIQV